MLIRQFDDSDWNAVWRIIEPVFRSGETYTFSPDIAENEAFTEWIKTPTTTYVAVDDENNILGTYFIKPNQPALGAHVCNCGYVVAERARGQGIASTMCIHSQKEALARGFRAMQYNLVVSVNESAVRLWQKLGFEIIGTIPGAFKHPKLGFTDAHIMYKMLEEE